MLKRYLLALGMCSTAGHAGATGSAAAGKALFLANCVICHASQPVTNSVGPTLSKVYGRRAGTAQGYAYSQAMTKSGIRWEDATLMRYLASPAAMVPGNNMSFPGIEDEGQRADLVAFLRDWSERP